MFGGEHETEAKQEITGRSISMRNLCPMEERAVGVRRGKPLDLVAGGVKIGAKLFTQILIIKIRRDKKKLGRKLRPCNRISLGPAQSQQF